MGFILNRNTPPDYLVTMGKGKEIITVNASGDAATDIANLQKAMNDSMEAPKLEKPKRRLKVEKRPDADVETIHKEDPGKQGPVGTDEQEAPPRDLGGDVTIGKGEDEDGEE